MIEIKFKDCCNECVQRTTYLDENKMYGEDRVYLMTTVIGCEHEKVCKKYIEEV